MTVNTVTINSKNFTALYNKIEEITNNSSEIGLSIDQIKQLVQKTIDVFAKKHNVTSEYVNIELAKTETEQKKKKVSVDALVKSWTITGLVLQRDWSKAVNALKLPEQVAFAEHCNKYFDMTGKSVGNRTDTRCMFCMVMNKDGSVSVYGGMWDDDRIQHFLRLVPHANSPVKFEDVSECLDLYLKGAMSYTLSPIPEGRVSGQTLDTDKIIDQGTNSQDDQSIDSQGEDDSQDDTDSDI